VPWFLLVADRFLLGLGLRFETDPLVNRLLVAGHSRTGKAPRATSYSAVGGRA